MKNKHKISNNHIKDLVVSTIIGSGILSLPNNLALTQDNHGWISIIISGLLVVLLAIMLDRVFKMHPSKTIFEIGRELFGDLIFNIFLLIAVLYSILILAQVARIFGEVLKSFLLEVTPIRVTILIMLLATAYLSRSDIEVLGRTATLVYPIQMGLIVFIIAVGFQDADFTNLLPVSNINFRKIPEGVYTCLYFYAGYEIITLVYTDSENEKDNLKYIIRAIFIVIAIYLAVYIIALAQFGAEQLKQLMWPTISIVSNVDLPGYFLENLEGIILAIWVVIIYSTMGPILYSSGKALQNIFKTKSHDIFILPLIPIVYFVSLIPRNIVQIYEELSKIVGFFSVTAIVLLPLLMYITALIKRRIKG